MNLNFLYIWLGIMLIVAIAAPLVRKIRGQNLPTSQDFVVVGFAIAGAISLLKILIKVFFTQQDLQIQLDWDGTIAISIGSLLGIYLALKEVIKLF